MPLTQLAPEQSSACPHDGILLLAGPFADRMVAASMLTCFRAVLRAGSKAKVSLVTFGLHAIHQQDMQQAPLSHLASGNAQEASNQQSDI